MGRNLLLGILVGLIILTANHAVASNIIYNDEATFLAHLGTFVTDDYSNSGYDIVASIDIFSNSAMNAVLGESDYTTTGFINHNLVYEFASVDMRYCSL